MAKPGTRKIGLEMDARLYAELSKLAKENGQSRRFLLEKALEHYLEFVMPMQGTVRPEVMSHFRRSTDKNRKLQELLGKKK
jgi:metal-responsive CopG/Arc/MetJ family transcriptional regulator